MAKNYDMVVIPKPAENTRTVLHWDKAMQGPLMRGRGQFNFRCGNCKRVLLENMPIDQIQNIVFVCPTCSNYNEMPPFTQVVRPPFMP